MCRRHSWPGCGQGSPAALRWPLWRLFRSADVAGRGAVGRRPAFVRRGATSMSNEQEPPMTVNAAVSALVKDLETDRMSTLPMLLYPDDAAADALDRITHAPPAPPPPAAS